MPSRKVNRKQSGAGVLSRLNKLQRKQNALEQKQQKLQQQQHTGGDPVAKLQRKVNQVENKLNQQQQQQQQQNGGGCNLTDVGMTGGSAALAQATSSGAVINAIKNMTGGSGNQYASYSQSYSQRGGNVNGLAVPAVLFLANHMFGKPLPNATRGNRPRGTRRRFSSRRR